MESRSKTRQYTRKDWLKWLLPVTLAIAVTVMSYFPLWIERNYCSGIYRYIANAQRFMFGWLPFSLGDLIYTFAGAWLAVRIIRTIVAVYRRKITREKTLRRTFRLARFDSGGSLSQGDFAAEAQGAPKVRPMRTRTAALRGTRMTGSFPGGGPAGGRHGREAATLRE